MINVMVGLVTEKLPNPSEESDVPDRERAVGGVELDKPLAALAGKTGTVPTPDIDIRSDPKVQVPETPPKVAPNVVACPTPDEPATTTTPAALVQYALTCRQGWPLALNDRVTLPVRTPE